MLTKLALCFANELTELNTKIASIKDLQEKTKAISKMPSRDQFEKKREYATRVEVCLQFFQKQQGQLKQIFTTFFKTTNNRIHYLKTIFQLHQGPFQLHSLSIQQSNTSLKTNLVN